MKIPRKGQSYETKSSQATGLNDINRITKTASQGRENEQTRRILQPNYRLRKVNSTAAERHKPIFVGAKPSLKQVDQHRKTYKLVFNFQFHDKRQMRAWLQTGRQSKRKSQVELGPEIIKSCSCSTQLSSNESC